MNSTHIIRTALLTALTIMASCGLSFAETQPDPVNHLALRKIMNDMGKNMQLITDGISRQDWALVKKSASKIAEHPKPPFKERMRIIGFIGVNISQFKEYDLKTRETAKKLSHFVSEENAISTFSILQNTCLDCHQRFREPFKERFYNKQ